MDHSVVQPPLLYGCSLGQEVVACLGSVLSESMLHLRIFVFLGGTREECVAGE